MTDITTSLPAAEMVALSQLRQELAEIKTPEDALAVRDKAGRMRDACNLMNRSVGECNEFAEIYLLATWSFGGLVKDIKPGAPKGSHNRQSKPVDDNGLMPGTEWQRKYARKLALKFTETEIEDYVRKATELSEQASIARLINLGPSRHGYERGEYEWYTPEKIIEAARAVMGGIDLDPSSNANANKIVKAKKFFTEEQNGLVKDWPGRVFLNPPFVSTTVREFATKLMDSFGTGHTTQAVWLSNACTDLGWWQDMASMGIVCFHRGRVKFYGPDGQTQSPPIGQTIIYLGENQKAFAEKFIEFGVILS